MDNLSDILRHRDFDMPPEVRAIKEYVRRYYDYEVHVTVQPRNITVSARSAALISSLRSNAPALQKAAQTEKKIVFRIS